MPYIHCYVALFDMKQFEDLKWKEIQSNKVRVF